MPGLASLPSSQHCWLDFFLTHCANVINKLIRVSDPEANIFLWHSYKPALELEIISRLAGLIARATRRTENKQTYSYDSHQSGFQSEKIPREITETCCLGAVAICSWDEIMRQPRRSLWNSDSFNEIPFLYDTFIDCVFCLHHKLLLPTLNDPLQLCIYLYRNQTSCTRSSANWWMALSCQKVWWHRTHPTLRMNQTCRHVSECMRVTQSTSLKSRRRSRRHLRISVSAPVTPTNRQPRIFQFNESVWLCVSTKTELALLRQLHQQQPKSFTRNAKTTTFTWMCLDV